MFKSAAASFTKLPPQRQSAVLLILGLSIMGICDSFVQAFSDRVGLGQFHFIRSFFAVICIIVIARFSKISLMPRRWGAVLVRTLFMVCAMMLFFSVLSFLPSAVAGAGLFTAPVFTLLFSALFFGTKIGWRRIAAIIFGTAGVILVLDVGEAGFQPLAILPIIAGAFYALAILMTSHYCQHENPFSLVIVFFIAIGGAGLLTSLILTYLDITNPTPQAAFLLRGWQAISFSDVLIIAVMALTTMTSIVMMARAYQISESSYSVVYEYSYLVSAALFGWLFWQIDFSFLTIAGMALIFVAGVIVTLASAKERYLDS